MLNHHCGTEAALKLFLRISVEKLTDALVGLEIMIMFQYFLKLLFRDDLLNSIREINCHELFKNQCP